MSDAKQRLPINIDQYLTGIEYIISAAMNRADLRTYTRNDEDIAINKRLEMRIIANRDGALYAAVTAAALFLESIDVEQFYEEDLDRIQRFWEYAKKAVRTSEITQLDIPNELRLRTRVEDIERIYTRTKIRW